MPFRSESQRRFLFAKHPRIAHRWAHEYGTPKNLPDHKGDKGAKGKEAAARWRTPEHLTALAERLRAPATPLRVLSGRGGEINDAYRRLTGRGAPREVLQRAGLLHQVGGRLRNPLAHPGVLGPVDMVDSRINANARRVANRLGRESHPAYSAMQDITQDIGAYPPGAAPAALLQTRDVMGRELRQAHGSAELDAGKVGGPSRASLQKMSRHSVTEDNMTLEEKVIDAFQMCDAAIGQAEKIQQEKQAADQQVAEEIPGLVDTLVKQAMIGDDEREELARALRDPKQTLVLFKRAMASMAEASTGRQLGEQVDANGRAAGTTKKASHVLGSENSPYVGVRTSEPKPSDLALLRGLGLS